MSCILRGIFVVQLKVTKLSLRFILSRKPGLSLEEVTYVARPIIIYSPISVTTYFTIRHLWIEFHRGLTIIFRKATPSIVIHVHNPLKDAGCYRPRSPAYDSHGRVYLIMTSRVYFARLYFSFFL